MHARVARIEEYSKYPGIKLGRVVFEMERKEIKICRQVLCRLHNCRTGHCVVERTRTALKFTKIKNARAKRVKVLFFIKL